VKHYVLTQAEIVKLALRLERLGLVEVMPHDQVKLRVHKTLRLRRHGPVRLIHGPAVIADFMGANFDKAGGLFRFEVRELSKATIALLQKRMERLATEMNELDAYLPPEQRETVGMALALRPYVVSWAMGLKPRAP
jgi:hypothetical protein